MRYKLLGKSGLRVAELALGTMTFGEDWGWGASKAESQRIFEAYANAGGNFIDTANRYTNGAAEAFVGEFIASDREHFVLSTKYTLSTRQSDPNASGSQRKNLVQALEASLKRLKTETIDLYWVHAWDELTPLEEVLRALDDQVRAGKILYTGISDTPAWVIARANTLAELRGWTPFSALQARYSLVDRAAERELFPMARSLGLALTAWSVLASGLLTGKFNDAASAPSRQESRLAMWGGPDQAHLAIAREVQVIAGEIGCTPSQVAFNWVRAHSRPGAPAIPLIGARKLAQVQDNLGCLDFELSPAHLQRLAASSPLDLGFPHDFLQEDEIRGLVYGGTYDLTDR